MDWTDKTVLITGASSGLGRALAVDLARRGADIVATARRRPLLDALAAEVEALGRRCVVVPGDAIDPATALEVIEAAYTTFGRVDVAVLNAGGGDASVMGEVDAAQVVWEMRKNYDTVVNFLCPLIDRMRDAGGILATTSSPAGFLGLPKSGPYSAAKGATRLLFDSCRVELAHTPLRFVTLYPGFTHTPGLNADEIPVPALIIDQDRAVREMVWALSSGVERHMFPKRIRWLIRLATWLPAGVRQRILIAVG